MGRYNCENTIIISRYNEDLEWIYVLLKETWINKCIIVNKGDDLPDLHSDKIQIIKSENIGREGETYLSYIINNYEQLPDNIWFVQGNPFDHSPDFLNLMSENVIQNYIQKNFQCLTWRYNEMIPPNIEFDHRFFIDGNRVIQYYIDSRNQQTVEQHEFFDYMHSLKVKELKDITPMPYGNYLHYMCGVSGIPIPKNIIPYCWSSIFFVKKEAIHLNKKNSYIKLKEILLSSDIQGGSQGFVLERLWNYILTHNSYDSLEELKTVNWKYSNFCGLWNKSNNLMLLCSKSHLIHPSVKPPKYNSHMLMIYYNNITRKYEVKDGIYYDFDATSIIPCLNLQTAKTLLSFNIDFQSNFFDPISSFGNILNTFLKQPTRHVRFNISASPTAVSATRRCENDKLLDKIGALALKADRSS